MWRKWMLWQNRYIIKSKKQDTACFFCFFLVKYLLRQKRNKGVVANASK